jgi:hypothetical protein
MDRIKLAQDNDKQRTYMNAVMKLRFELIPTLILDSIIFWDKHCVVRLKSSDVSEEPTASIFKVESNLTQQERHCTGLYPGKS